MKWIILSIVALFLIYAIVCTICGFDIIGLTRKNWVKWNHTLNKKERFDFWKKHFFKKD